jgi:hypothetical protein
MTATTSSRTNRWLAHHRRASDRAEAEAQRGLLLPGPDWLYHPRSGAAWHSSPRCLGALGAYARFRFGVAVLRAFRF